MKKKWVADARFAGARVALLAALCLLLFPCPGCPLLCPVYLLQDILLDTIVARQL